MIVVCINDLITQCQVHMTVPNNEAEKLKTSFFSPNPGQSSIFYPDCDALGGIPQCTQKPQ